MSGSEATYAVVRAFIDELVRAGVGHVCFSPGSRSTPLILTAARHPQLRLWQHIDERSAGFFALGLAKQLHAPVALLCSSGTAAANFLPAIVEAYFDRVPLLVLTADRPPELQQSGAPQTIHQDGLYGAHVKRAVTMPVPIDNTTYVRYARNAAAQLLGEAMAGPAGPVHANFPFREPLLPTDSGVHNAHSTAPTTGEASVTIPRRASDSRAGDVPFTRVHAGSVALVDADARSLVDELRAHREGLIVVGPQRDAAVAKHVVALGETLGYPVLADPLSGVRYGWGESAVVIDGYDAFLRDRNVAAALAPQVVLRFGAWPTSKALLLYLQQHVDARHIVVDEPGGWRDPLRIAAHIVHAQAAVVCRQLRDALPGDLAHTQRSWLRRWDRLNAATRQAVTEQVAKFDSLFEGRIFTELQRILPAKAVLYVGNSMPVRDLDTFGFKRKAPLQCHANRGANGIDGVVSSALGAAAAAKRPTVLVIGDLSFYHDLNGLLAAKQHGLNLTVILVHNDGGGIFSFLPQAALTDSFEPLFGTPHGLDFEPVVRMYGGGYVKANTWDDFRTAVADGVSQGGLNVVEVRTERKPNEQMHRDVWEAVRRQTTVLAHA